MFANDEKLEISSAQLIQRRTLRDGAALLRHPWTRFQPGHGEKPTPFSHRRARHKGHRARVIAWGCAPATNGNGIFADKGESSIGHGAPRRRAGTSGDPSRRKSGGRTSRRRRRRARGGSMINTRALFSDFLPRDPRAQIACK